jgi:methyl-accepting chemotaxis protein
MTEPGNRPQRSAATQETRLPYGPDLRLGLATMLTAGLATLFLAQLGFPFALLVGVIGSAGIFGVARQRRLRERVALMAVLDSIASLEPSLVDEPVAGSVADFIRAWNRRWPDHCASIRQLKKVADGIQELPARLESTFDSIEEANSNQEEAVEETASLVANMRQSMRTIGERIEALLSSSDESTSAAVLINRSIDEVASNTATLHEVVEASTSSVHEMGASIRQVATGAEQVQTMAESTASSVIEMDRSMQLVSSNALEASSLTERAHEGATAGAEAVRATIYDIERISSLTNNAKDQLGGLLARVSKIGNILSAIDEINDETKLLSLNAAIIAAKAGHRGKAFLVVANHVKTLSQRTAASTRDIEELIADIEREAADTVRAMETGIDAVAQGMERSRDAGAALATIQVACRDASERVGEIARATAEQSRSSKGVAEATQTTSTQIQQIAAAITEQRRASESMLENAERALDACRHVHRSTDEQRVTSQNITDAVHQISEMIGAIGEQTTVHARASESVSESVMHLLENARQSGAKIDPIREWLTQFVGNARVVASAEGITGVPASATASPARAGSSSPNAAGTIDSRSR